MATARKKEIVKDLQGLLTQSQVLVFTDYRGMSVSEITNLRRQLREKGVEYHVTKNTLTTLAANRTGLENLEQMLDGPTAIAFIGEDIPGGARALTDFVRTSKVLTIRGGLAGRTLLNPDQVSDLTKMLTREQYIAKVLGSMQSPIASLVNVLNGTIQGLVNVMQARIDQLKEQGDTSAESAPVTASTETVEATNTGEAPADAGESAAEAPEAPDTAETPEAPAEATEATEAAGETGEAS
jgi:large subunit ribosomal protein L10